MSLAPRLAGNTGRLVLGLTLLATALMLPRHVRASAFCHVVDGSFTDCLGDGSNKEWSDVHFDVFFGGRLFVGADQDAGKTALFLMYDYIGGACGADQCGTVEFDVMENGKLDHYKVVVGPTCATNFFDVFVNGVKLPEHLEEGIVARAGCGTSPNGPAPHEILELSVPLRTVYQPDDPRFWSSGIQPPPPAPNGDCDGDGVPDTVDNCVCTPNPDQADTDGDGIGDVCDPCPGVDSDGDGVPDDRDNCPSVPNADQKDTDGDGAGDVCDSCPNDPTDSCPGADRDGDGIPDSDDNCPSVPNADQADADFDGFGDACDPCKFDDTNTCLLPPACQQCPSPDSDGDGVPDVFDNCPSVPNPDQSDRDGDGEGDVCDSCPDSVAVTCAQPVDSDGDGIPNSDDNCPGVANANQADADGDGFGDACDPCPADVDQACLCLGPKGSRKRAPSGPSGLIEGHASILTAHSDGTTSSAPRALCASPEVCANPKTDNPKIVQKFIKSKYDALLKCLAKGTKPCDLGKVNKIGPLSSPCRALAECLVDSSVELMFGNNNPPPGPVKDKCATAIGKEGTKFVNTLITNHIQGKDAKTTLAAGKAESRLGRKCGNPIGPPADLGGDCHGQAANPGAIGCLFLNLERVNPLP